MKAARFALASMAVAGCGPATPAPVELRIEPVEPPGPSACAAGDRWDGARCVADRAASGECPPGTALVAGGKLSPPDAQPITVRSVCMDVTEVTTGAYMACVHKGRCDTEKLDTDAACNHSRRDRYDHPINCVSWEQANRYCRAEGKRLPSAEEWLWAAQGRAAARDYPWGSAPPTEQLCWSNGQARKGTCPVGSFPSGRSPQGINDLVGNVWEWASPKMRNGVANVTGGASWQNGDGFDIHRENVGNFEADFERNDVVGFRCVLDAPVGEKRD